MRKAKVFIKATEKGTWIFLSGDFFSILFLQADLVLFHCAQVAGAHVEQTLEIQQYIYQPHWTLLLLPKPRCTELLKLC